MLTDKSLGEWWGVREAPNGPKAAFARASSDSKKVKWWEADAKPLLKVDLEAIPCARLTSRPPPYSRPAVPAP